MKKQKCELTDGHNATILIIHVLRGENKQLYTIEKKISVGLMEVKKQKTTLSKSPAFLLL